MSGESGELVGGVPLVSYRKDVPSEHVIVQADVLLEHQVADPPSQALTKKKIAALVDKGLNEILLGKTTPKSASEWARTTKDYITIAKDLGLIDSNSDVANAGTEEERLEAFERIKRQAQKAILSGD